MANYEATRYDFNAANLTGIQGVNTGLIIPWPDASVPSGFLECDGSAVSRTTYAGLFAVVGTNYGTGDGSTTFNLPNLQNRVCVHKSPTKAQFSTGGADTVAATGNVTGGAAGNTTIDVPTMAAHTHPRAQGAQGGYGPGSRGTSYPNVGSFIPTGGGGAHGHSVSSATFTGGADSVLQPYMAMLYIIKT